MGAQTRTTGARSKSLKEKFDKLVYTKKPTGDYNCPKIVRRAKHRCKRVETEVLLGLEGAV